MRIIIYTIMKALEHQFNRQKQSLRNDIQRFGKKERKDQETIRDFERRLTALNKVLIEMKGLFSKEKDSKEKKGLITKSEEEVKGISAMIKQANNKFDEASRAKLFEGVDISNPTTKLSNDRLMEDNLAGINNVVNDAYDMKDQTQNIVAQLVDDNLLIDKIGEAREEIDADVATTNKLTKIQKNQELLKRLILIGLAALLTFWDIILLVLKIR